MKSIFDETSYQELLNRISNLRPDSIPLWGKMSVGQMVWHCQIPLKVAIENKQHNKTGNLLIRWFFKKSLYNDKPWRKNLPTSPLAKAREPKDFTREREKLLEMIHQMHALDSREYWNPHPIFGRFTHQQWGQLQYKHLDHHLNQFGV